MDSLVRCGAEAKPQRMCKAEREGEERTLPRSISDEFKIACTARRMAEAAIYLTDTLMPPLPAHSVRCDVSITTQTLIGTFSNA